MNIIIETQETDSDQLDAFVTATNWKIGSGIAKEDWLNLKVKEWISSMCLQGGVMLSTKNERSAYQSAIKAASISVKTTLDSKPITVGSGIKVP